MSKRKFDDSEELDSHKQFLKDIAESGESNRPQAKHTLDSDEEDNEDEGNVLDDNEIEGEEDGISRIDDDNEVKITPFNMREEMEEGHFDGDGHYQFKKDNDLKDNWLDNIDWIKVKKDSNYKQKKNATDDIVSSSDDDDDEEKAEMQARKERFNLVESYKEILGFMKPQESINRTLQRLNKSKTKMTTAQRFKMKKAGVVDECSENITKITGVVNEILTQTGNMDVYEETYEDIKNKIKEQEDKQQAGPSKAAELDMYADDFDEKEVGKLNTDTSTTESKTENNELMWEYKVTQSDPDDKINGPFTTVVMQKKAESGDFKECVFVRKVIKDRKDDDDSRFYSSARMDFELYL